MAIYLTENSKRAAIYNAILNYSTQSTIDFLNDPVNSEQKLDTLNYIEFLSSEPDTSFPDQSFTDNGLIPVESFLFFSDVFISYFTLVEGDFNEFDFIEIISTEEKFKNFINEVLYNKFITDSKFNFVYSIIFGIDKTEVDTMPLSLDLYISSILPKHIRENNPNFVTFLKQYSKWAEWNGNVHNIMHIFGEHITSEAFFLKHYELFRKEYLSVFPSDTLIDKQLFLKFIREIYASKGNVSAIKFFFKIIVGDKNVEILFPRTRSTIASDRLEYVLKIVETNVTQERRMQFFDLVGKSKILQSNEFKTFATIENVTSIDIVVGSDIKTVFEITVSNRKSGVFKLNETVFVENFDFNYEQDVVEFKDIIIKLYENDVIGNYELDTFRTPQNIRDRLNDVILSQRIIFNLNGLLGNYIIENAGTGYKVGDRIIIPVENSLIRATAYVSSVNSSGSISSIVIENSGVLYTSDQVVSNIETQFGQNAVIRFTLTAEHIIRDVFENVSDKTDLFKYKIKTSVPERVWGKLLTATVHPAGTKYESELSLINSDSKIKMFNNLELKSSPNSEINFKKLSQTVNFSNPNYSSSREFFEPSLKYFLKATEFATPGMTGTDKKDLYVRNTEIFIGITNSSGSTIYDDQRLSLFQNTLISEIQDKRFADNINITVWN